MRLFLAIYPPKNYLDLFRDALRKLNREKRSLIYIPIDQMHVTMKYIGSQVSEESANKLINEFKLHEGNFGKAILNVERIQFGFAKQTFPNILMARLEDNESLLKITSFSHDLIKKLHLFDTIRFKELRSNKYHISIARLKANATKKVGKNIQKFVNAFQLRKPEPVEIGVMYFVESIIPRDGRPIYRKLERIIL